MEIIVEGEGDERKRDKVSHTVQDILAAVDENQRFRKADNVDVAQICPLTRKIEVVSSKSNIVKNHGYTIEGKSYLCPEEALFFLETLKLEILLEKIPLSVERCRNLFLAPDESKKFDGTTCQCSEYTVYKFLAKQGYRSRRPSFVLAELQKPLKNLEKASESQMQDVDMNVSSASSPNAKESPGSGIDSSTTENVPSPGNATKRKRDSTATVSNGEADENGGKKAKIKTGADSANVAQDVGNLNEASMSPEIICGYESDSSSIKCTYYSDHGQETIYELDNNETSVSPNTFNDEPLPSTSRGVPSEKYTVQEVDSDIEFVDEVIHCGVDIEELADSEEDEELPDITEPGTSKQSMSFTTLRNPTKNHVFVDLVSSDDEDDTQDLLKDYTNHIWSQFVPRPKAKFCIPPSELIPKEIRRSHKDTGSESCLLKLDDDCDLELKEIVDGLKLDSDTENSPRKLSHRNRAKSWGDWREQEAKELQDVFHGSLFGADHNESKTSTGCDSSFNHTIINGWERVKLPKKGINEVANGTDSTNNNISPSCNSSEYSYSFDLYPPTENKFGKKLLGSVVKPSYRVIIQHETDAFMNFSKLTTPKDQVPFLVAVVNEDQEVTFVSPGNDQIPDLFQSCKC